MFMRMVYDEHLAEAAYLIGCQRTGEAIIIDPQRDVDRYEQLAAANGLRIVATAETHIHADFVSGSRELAERGAMVYVSDEGDADWKYQWLDRKVGGGAYRHRLLRHGDTFMIGNIEFRAVHTPGHTPEHICFMITDRGGGADRPIGVATGDFVFVGDVGRPDLLERAAGIVGKADDSAHALYRSVREFMTWPDYLQVWPAHGAGSACGKALGAVPSTTVGYEKMFNPAIRAAQSEDEFVRSILHGQPEPPMYFANMKRVNKVGPRVLGGVPSPDRVAAAHLASLDPRQHTIIDTRPWAKFRDGHIPGSLHIPLNSSFNTDAGSLVPEGRTLWLIVDQGRVEEAVRDLIRVGLDIFGGWTDPGEVDTLCSRPSAAMRIREVDIDGARDLIARGTVSVLDVRRASEHAERHIDGSLNVSHTRLLGRMNEVPRDRTVLVHCRSGARSARACSLLAASGFDVVNMAGGMLAWEQRPAVAGR